MAIGFNPSFAKTLDLGTSSKELILVVACETAKQLYWKIVPLQANNFVAWSDASTYTWSEEIRITIHEGKLEIVSRCMGSQMTDWGKNKRNIEAFTEAFEENLVQLDEDTARLKFAELAAEFPQTNADQLQINYAKRQGILSYFKVSKGYDMTPSLFYLNVLLFILMVASGVDITLPHAVELMAWGANYGPDTFNGEWWRLFTSCFLHIGILHLAFNMFALLYIGRFLEPLIGKWRFLVAYLVTGLAGSIASILWHDMTVSAGASGAIFGMYGLFLAMLTTNLIELTARKALISSIGIFVAFNLLYGMQAEVDNAAHVGGLIAGLLLGYALYFVLRKKEGGALGNIVFGGAAFAILGICLVVLTTVQPFQMREYGKGMNKYEELEMDARLYHCTDFDEPTYRWCVEDIEKESLPAWKEALALLHELNDLNVPYQYHERTLKIIEYTELRIEVCKGVLYNFYNDTNLRTTEIELNEMKIEHILSELSVPM